MNNICRGVLILGTGLFLGGCASIPPPYKPTTMGNLNNGEPNPSLKIVLAAETPVIAIGDVLALQIRIQNVGSAGVWLPRQPTILVSWIYPDGIRDNFLQELPRELSYGFTEGILLKPGEQISRTVPVRTYYFDRAGITEFRALLYAARNTNPELNPCWSGRLHSNSYGVLVESPRKRSRAARMANGARRDLPDA